MIIFIICWVEWMLRYLSLNTCLFSSEDFACKLRNNREYQELAGVQKACTILEWLPDQATLIVLSSIPCCECLLSGVEWHNTLTAACTLIDKVMSIKRAIQIGGLGLEDCTVETAWGLEDLRTCIAVVEKNEFVSNCRSILTKRTRNIDRYRTAC